MLYGKCRDTVVHVLKTVGGVDHERSSLLFVARVTHVYAAFSRIQIEKERAVPS